MIGNQIPQVNNNIINRRPQIPQDYMIGNSNRMNNMNNMNNNIKNTNVRVGLKMNLNKTNNIKNNTNNVPNTNNYMNRNINPNNNITRNLSNNNNMNSDNMINKALSLIRTEFRKKDEKIKSLELKVEELENQLNLLRRNNAINNNDYSNQIQNNNYVGNTNNYNEQPKKMGKNFTFSEKYSDEIHYMNKIEEPNNNNMNRMNKMREINSNQNHLGNAREVNYQNNSNNQYNVNRINENDYMSHQPKNKDANNEAQRENSIKTWNSGNYHGWSKLDVKLYLTEVKAKLDQKAFKEFIHSIKLLTSTKGEGNIDKSTIVERVRNLLGERHDDLFIKFKNIIGYNE